MSDLDRIEQRLAAVERVVVDGDVELPELSTLASIAEDVAHLERRVEEHEERIATLEATTQSIGGYVGEVEAVNESVEREAATAVVTVDRLERRLDALEESIEASSGADRSSEAGVTDGTEVAGAIPDRSDSASDAGSTLGTDQFPRADDGAGSAAGGFQFGDVSDPEADPEDVVTAILDAPAEPVMDEAGASGVDAVGRDESVVSGNADAASATGSDRPLDDGSATAATDGGAEATARSASREAIARELFDESPDERVPEDGVDGEDDGSSTGVLSTIRSKLP